MPSATHPRAKFDPIPPDLDLNALVEATENFDYVARISAKKIKELGIDDFERVVLQHVIIGGKPLVVDGWDAELPPWTFSPTWLIENVGTKPEQVRDIGQSANMPMTIGHYMKSLAQLTKNMTPKNFRDPKRQRLYLKDIDCPDTWYQKLEEVIPQQLFYYNESIGEKGGLGATRERNSFGQIISGKGIAPAGDLMSSLPPEMRAENFMCYIGHEGTYTPAHREMCASLGQNIMVETSTEETGETPGTSIWFMTESKDREVVSEFFLSMLGHDIEIENHFAQINAWKKAPFPVYIVEQKAGDFILIPPLAPHQVWNRGTRTMKAAWNRTTVETLEMAINEALPRARLVCRDEQYKNKAIIYYTLEKYCGLLEQLETQTGGIMYDEYGRLGSQSTNRVKQLQRDFRRLFDLFTTVLTTEMFDPLHLEKKVEFLKYDSNVTCSYCRCNIFNRFLTCKSCIITSDDGKIEDTYDICMECYAMGRSCACVSNLSWVEQWKWSDLTYNHEKWRARVISILTLQAIDGQIDLEITPQPLNTVRKKLGKMPVAQICQEQLKIRPYRDPSKPYVPTPLPGDSDNEPEADDDGNLIKKKPTKRMSQQRKKTHHSCHICRKAEENWKLAFCCECTRAYCYGVLYRAFDLMPQTVMEQADWSCPKCLKICSCAACRRDRKQKPYQPKGTLLGHDTKKVADYRSVESLVDFSRTNLGWLKGEDDDNPQASQRMKNLVTKAIEQKALGDQMEDAIGEDDPQYANTGLIDPRLGGGSITPNEPLYANAYQEAGLVQDSQGMLIYDRHSFNAHPEHDDFDESLYPELPDFGGRERVMGAGYYQQEPGPGAILYIDPEAASSLGEHNSPDIEYPKLPPKEPEIVYTSKGAKRKRSSIAKSTPRGANDARSEYIQAQKKQKLAEARANDKFVMTQHQLDGGEPLVVKLQVSPDFLHHLKSSSTKKTRPTRASLRAKETKDEDDVEMVDSPHVIKSDVRPVVINSDDEFDLALQAMSNFKSSRIIKTEPQARGFTKRGAPKTRGTRGTAKPSRITHRQGGSSEEVESQILNEASTRIPRSKSTDSVEQADKATPVGTRGRGRPKSSRHAEDDFVPSASLKKATPHRANSTEDEESSDEETEKYARRPAGKRPSRAPKFTTQAVTNDGDHDEEQDDMSDSAHQKDQPVINVLSDSELEVASKPTPALQRRGRPSRQAKSLGGVAPVEEPNSKSSGRANHRKSAPVAKMVADESYEEEQGNGKGKEPEVPETQDVLESQQFTNRFTPLNHREIGGRRSASWAARDNSEAPAESVSGMSVQMRRSIRFEDTPNEEAQNTPSPPRGFATFAESDSSPEPIDYSIFEDYDTVLVNRDDDLDGDNFPRGSKSFDNDGDVEMDSHSDSTSPVEIPKVTDPALSKANRGRPAKKSNLSVINNNDLAPTSTRKQKQSTTGPTSKNGVSSRKPQAANVVSDDDKESPPPPVQIKPISESVLDHISTSTNDENSEEADLESRQDDEQSLVPEIRSPTPPIAISTRRAEKASVPIPSPSPALVSVPPKKMMTEEERIIEENRRAKQAILARLENDDYYSADEYSVSEDEEQEEVQPGPSKPIEEQVLKRATRDEEDNKPTKSMSPYFSMSTKVTAVTTATTQEVNPSEPSVAAKKFSRSVVAAGKLSQKRKPGFASDSLESANNSMLSLAEKRAQAGRKTKFAVMPANEVVKDRFGNLLKKNSTPKSSGFSIAGPSKSSTTVNKNGSTSGSGKKRDSGISGAANTLTGKDMKTSNIQSSDDDDSDTSIPAFRPATTSVGMARRGGTLGILAGSRRGGALRGRGSGEGEDQKKAE